MTNSKHTDILYGVGGGKDLTIIEAPAFINHLPCKFVSMNKRPEWQPQIDYNPTDTGDAFRPPWLSHVHVQVVSMMRRRISQSRGLHARPFLI